MLRLMPAALRPTKPCTENLHRGLGVGVVSWLET